MEECEPEVVHARPERGHGLAHDDVQREAIALVDSQIAPALLYGKALREALLGELLDRLSAVAELTLAEPCNLTFHVAPLSQRLQWWRPDSEVTRALRSKSALAEWLDATTRIAAVARTAPNRAENVRDFQAVTAMFAAP